MTDDFIGNKVVDIVVSRPRPKSKEKPGEKVKERYISPDGKQNYLWTYIFKYVNFM